MKSPSSKFLNYSGVLLLAASIYVCIQLALVYADFHQVKGLQDSICKTAELKLQTGAIREALDFSESSLQLIKPFRRRHIILREGEAVSELGSPVSAGIITFCRPTGRTDTLLTIAVERRAFTANSGFVGSVSLVVSFLLFGAARLISRKTQELTIDFIESELANIFGVSLKQKQGTPLLSRFSIRHGAKSQSGQDGIFRS
ncbi:MAG: hypothetical protein HC883_02020 [Bdellovibrionaceae bacterium]|nr:hypothetical protein [Pseudobdellovibrionaceae bacterium]